MNNDELTQLLSQYKQQYSHLTKQINSVVNENNILHQQVAKSASTSAESHRNNQNPQNDFLSSQLLETEQNLLNERQQVVKTMAQVWCTNHNLIRRFLSWSYFAISPDILY